MHLLIAGLAVTLAVLMPYTMGMQQTTLALGWRISVIARDFGGTGLQDAITARAQTARIFLVVALMLAVFGLTTYTYAWYHGLWVLILSMLVGLVIKVAFRLTPGHPRLVRAIVGDPERRRREYEAAGDRPRVVAVEEVLRRLRAAVEGADADRP